MTTTSPGHPQADVPHGLSLAGLRNAVQTCQACDLGRQPGVRAVTSEGPATARIALVGEQPGDVEDRQGRPFVGPAGQVLDRALADVGLDRRDLLVTNSVRHFRYRTDRPGGRRIHVTPELVHMQTCRPWLRAELRIVDPEVVVLLGATATTTMLGPHLRVMRDRGRLIPRPTHDHEPAVVHLAWFLVTIHPSAVLRADDRDTAYAGLVADLRIAVDSLAVGN